MTQVNADVKPLLNTGAWLDILHKGGNVAHFWRPTNRSGESAWFDVNDSEQRREAFRSVAGGDVYVSVNPSYQVPPHNKSGNTNPVFIAKQAAYIGCLNVLITEYDGKDYVEADEYAPYLPGNIDTLSKQEQRTARKMAKEMAFYMDPGLYKLRAYAAIERCAFAPTIIIDSGGGYHCYWVLSDTLYLDDSNRADVVDTQHGFVRMNGGDIGRADISSFLRVPGTRNCKVGWGGRDPMVQVIEYNPDLVWDYAEIESVVMDWQMEQREAGKDVHDALDSVEGTCASLGTVRATFNAKYGCVKLLEKKGYQVVHQNKDKSGAVALTRMSRPGKEGVPSVTVFPPTTTQPEVAVMWSGNDELYSDMDEQGKREGRDAYKIFMVLYCGGDGKKSWEIAKKHLGMWR